MNLLNVSVCIWWDIINWDLICFHSIVFFCGKAKTHTIYRAYGACQLSVSFASGLTKPWASLQETFGIFYPWKFKLCRNIEQKFCRSDKYLLESFYQMWERNFQQKFCCSIKYLQKCFQQKLIGKFLAKTWLKRSAKILALS